MEKRRNETALIYGETTLTYGQLDKASQQLAKRFEEKGAVGSIGGFTTTPVSFVISMLASWRCGKVFVPLCLTHSNLELNYFIDDSNVRTVAVFSKNDLNEDFIDTLIEKKIAIEETTKDDDTIVGDTFTVGDTLTDTGGALGTLFIYLFIVLSSFFKKLYVYIFMIFIIPHLTVVYTSGTTVSYLYFIKVHFFSRLFIS